VIKDFLIKNSARGNLPGLASPKILFHELGYVCFVVLPPLQRCISSIAVACSMDGVGQMIESANFLKAKINEIWG
jgi:hypothetical protein